MDRIERKRQSIAPIGVLSGRLGKDDAIIDMQWK